MASMIEHLCWSGRAAWHHALLRHSPRVLCNSFQKSGTHLLVGLAETLPGLHTYDRKAYWHYLNRARVSPARGATLEFQCDRLRRCLPGEILRGHIAAEPHIVQLLAEMNFRHLFIHRDPRDIVVSLFHWWQRHEEIDVWPYRYFRALPDDEARLRFIITGWPNDLGALAGTFPRDVAYPHIGARFAEFLPWLEQPSCLAVRFEDLVDANRRQNEYAKITRHILPQADDRAVMQHVQRMAQGADPSRSRTFRKGVAGQWRQVLSDEHISLLKQHAQQTLIALGYERNEGWGR